jgi:hypothetical protein
MEAEPTVIYRTGKMRPRTAQTARDERTLELRKRKVGSQYAATEACLERALGRKLTRKKLLAAANQLYERRVVEYPPDRLCKRKKEALICWFCENVRPPAGPELPMLPIPLIGFGTGDTKYVNDTSDTDYMDAYFGDSDLGGQRDDEFDA